MSCHVLTRQSCHVSGRVTSSRFFGVMRHASRLVAHSCIMACIAIYSMYNLVLCSVPVILSCYVLLSLLVSCHVVSCNDSPCSVLWCRLSVVVSFALATRRKSLRLTCLRSAFGFASSSCCFPSSSSFFSDPSLQWCDRILRTERHTTQTWLLGELLL